MIVAGSKDLRGLTFWFVFAVRCQGRLAEGPARRISPEAGCQGAEGGIRVTGQKPIVFQR